MYCEFDYMGTIIGLIPSECTHTVDDYSEFGVPCELITNMCCEIDINCVYCENTMNCLIWNH